MALSVRLARNAARRTELAVHSFDIPAFLCPALLNYRPQSSRPLQQYSPFKARRRCIHSAVAIAESPELPTPAVEIPRRLPTICTGCGALAQIHNADEAGFYSLNRKSVRDYLDGEKISGRSRRKEEEDIVLKALQNADGDLAASLSIDLSSTKTPTTKEEILPLCDRCHKLSHHNTGVSIHHPTITSLQDTIYESPYKYNHIYHVLDAADFPMSLIPRIHQLLSITPQRSQNRRAKTGRFFHNRKTEMSFIITRSDLLAPQKTQVDSLMPYLTEVLRDALGRNNRDVRLGNVRCVSAKRDWWTKELKEDIWERGGGGWMVGKVNVGKSRLFSTVFPKGRLATPKIAKPVDGAAMTADASQTTHKVPEVDPAPERTIPVEAEYFDPNSLLPPALPEVNYPAMPLVSALPGTTASPIRVPYGSGKGELIDLPGLSRGDLELHVQPEHRSSLVMHSRVVPEQQVIKPGQSLLLGGMIRITPSTPDLIFLAYAFVPIPDHLTSTEKAIAIQEQREDAPKAQIIALPETAEKISSAGIFKLRWDVTKQRAGPVTRPNAAGIKPENLPFRVLSTDILIEGCGWVELVAQVRRKDFEIKMPPQDNNDQDEEIEFKYPEVEIFSPEGRFVAARRPMNGWLLGGPRKKPAGARKTRPRPSKKGEKKREKVARRSKNLS